jgi:hypothetical protein
MFQVLNVNTAHHHRVRIQGTKGRIDSREIWKSITDIAISGSFSGRLHYRHSLWHSLHQVGTFCVEEIIPALRHSEVCELRTCLRNNRFVTAK